MSLLNAPQPPLCRLYPAWMAVQLRHAMRMHDSFDRLKAIDDITDSLAAQGYCRERSSDARLHEWAAIRSLYA